MRRLRQVNAWLDHGFRPVYLYVVLAAGATLLVLLFGSPHSWGRWYFPECFTMFGILTFLRLVRARRRRWAVRFANGRIHPLLKEQEAREMAHGGAWGRPTLLHRVDADADWVEHP